LVGVAGRIAPPWTFFAVWIAVVQCCPHGALPRSKKKAITRLIG
jgi:hypothetical protein